MEDLPIGHFKNIEALQKLFAVLSRCDLATMKEVEGYIKIEDPNQCGRTVEDFCFEKLPMRRIKMHDIDINVTASFTRNRVARGVERKIDALVSPPPDQGLVELIMAELRMTGFPVSGEEDEKAKALKMAAEAYLWLNKAEWGLIKTTMQTRAQGEDWKAVLANIHQKYPPRAANPFQQFDRDLVAVSEPGILELVDDKTILLVVDKSNRILHFHLVNAMQTLYSPDFVRKLVTCIDKWVYHSPMPAPDLVRHPLHVYDWLWNHPEFDIRRAKDPHRAVAGTEHYGCMSMIGDPRGERGEGLYKHKAITKLFRKTWDMLEPLEDEFFHKALGKFTDAVNSCFSYLDPDLYSEYQKIWRNAPRYARMDTKDEDDGWTYRALLANVSTQDHKDKSDWYRGLAAIVPMGNFTGRSAVPFERPTLTVYKGGNLVLRQLGLQLPFSSGSMSLVAGNQVNHSIAKWEGEKRYSVVHAHHDSVKQFVESRMAEAAKLQTVQAPASISGGKGLTDQETAVNTSPTANDSISTSTQLAAGRNSTWTDKNEIGNRRSNEESTNQETKTSIEPQESSADSLCLRQNDWTSDEEGGVDTSDSDVDILTVPAHDKPYKGGLYREGDEGKDTTSVKQRSNAQVVRRESDVGETQQVFKKLKHV